MRSCSRRAQPGCADFVNLTGSDRILQIHPTRRCNLRCLHCYSDSSPEATETLSEAVVTQSVADAARLGYTVVSVSGGEPFMYRPLPALLRAARRAGMRTQVVSNGLSLTRRGLDTVEDTLDLLAVSLDGAPADHDRMRGMVGAFSRLEKSLGLIRESGIPFALLFTLTMFNVHQLGWAADFARRQGARMLQIHPLEAVGRGSGLSDEVPDETEGAMALLEAMRLQEEYRADLTIHVDIATVSQLRSLGRARLSESPALLSEVLSPLVIEPDGMCVPFEYGFPRAYALGDIRTRRLPDLAAEWIRDVYPDVFAAASRLQADVESADEGVVVNSYQKLRDALATPLSAFV